MSTKNREIVKDSVSVSQREGEMARTTKCTIPNEREIETFNLVV